MNIPDKFKLPKLPAGSDSIVRFRGKNYTDLWQLLADTREICQLYPTGELRYVDHFIDIGTPVLGYYFRVTDADRHRWWEFLISCADLSKCIEADASLLHFKQVSHWVSYAAELQA